MFGGQEFEEKPTECPDNQEVEIEGVQEQLGSWKPNEDGLLRNEPSSQSSVADISKMSTSK